MLNGRLARRRTSRAASWTVHIAPTLALAMAEAMLMGFIVDAVDVAIELPARTVLSSIDGSVNLPDGVRTIPELSDPSVEMCSNSTLTDSSSNGSLASIGMRADLICRTISAGDNGSPARLSTSKAASNNRINRPPRRLLPRVRPSNARGLLQPAR